MPRKRVAASYATPGPGSYSPPSDHTRFKAQRASSFGGRLAKQDRYKTGPLGSATRSQVPGPGHYPVSSGLREQAVSTRRTAPSGRFGTAPRSSAASQYYSGMMAAPAVEQVNLKRSATMPGPGAYQDGRADITSKKATAPAHSFGGKLARTKRPPPEGKVAPNPGPGAYETAGLVSRPALSKNKRTTGGGFSRASRDSRVVAPGMQPKPGDAPATRGSNAAAPPDFGPATSSLARQALSKKKSAPAFTLTGRGAGSDTVKVDRRGNVTFNSSRVSPSPGPGSYDAIGGRRGATRAVGGQFARATRPEIIGEPPRNRQAARRREVATTPSVGTYNVAVSSVGAQADSRRPASAAHSFGRARREEVERTCAPDTPIVPRSVTPGPGTYEGPSALGTQHRSTHRTQQSFSFSTDSRAAFHKAYKGFGEGKGDPNLDSRGKDAPPPGAYDPGLAHRPRDPAFTFGGKGVPRGAPGLETRPRSAGPKSRQHAEAPGPGAYEPERVAAVGSHHMGDSTKSRAPTFGFGTADRSKADTVVTPGAGFTSLMVTPGPGTYEGEASVGRQTSSRHASAPAASFGSGTREQHQRARAPEKPSLRLNDAPGPGAYDPAPADMDITLRHTPSFGFGTGERDQPGLLNPTHLG